MLKIINTTTADNQFSKLIRARDPICGRCRKKRSTDCSHYWERGHSATRYDPRNADGVCRLCHQIWEGRKEGYEEFKRKQLGDEGYGELERLHRTTMPRETAIMNFMKIRKTLKAEPQINYEFN